MTWLQKVLWGLRTFSKERQFLRGDLESFRSAGYRIGDFLENPIWYLRNIGVKLIGRYGLRELDSVLVEKLTDRGEAPIVRRNCAHSLSLIPPPSEDAINALTAALRDSYWEVRTEALQTLMTTQEPSEHLTCEIAAALCGTEPATLGQSSPRMRGQQVREGNFEVRATIAQALGRLGVSPLVLDALEALASDRNWIVRAQAAIAVADFGSRNPDLSERGKQILRAINPLSDGLVPNFVMKQKLAQCQGGSSAGESPGGAPCRPAELYLNLKDGWYQG